MKLKINSILNVLMGVLLLISLSFSIPASSQQRSVPLTEWSPNKSQPATHSLLETYSKKSKVDSDRNVLAEFHFRLLVSLNTFEVRLKAGLQKALSITIPTPRANIFFSAEDDDYLLKV